MIFATITTTCPVSFPSPRCRKDRLKKKKKQYVNVVRLTAYEECRKKINILCIINYRAYGRRETGLRAMRRIYRTVWLSTATTTNTASNIMRRILENPNREPCAFPTVFPIKTSINNRFYFFSRLFFSFTISIKPPIRVCSSLPVAFTLIIADHNRYSRRDAFIIVTLKIRPSR